MTDRPSTSHSLDRSRFEAAIRRFDEENARDPNREVDGGGEYARELLYARRLTDWVLKLRSDPPEPLLLAARSQHLCRWEIPRNTYEMNRTGYLRWRNDLKKFHAQKSSEILRETGYPEETIRQVQALNLKKNFPADPDAQTLEDALCLVFLEHQFADLAHRTDAGKMINALQKSWKKMSPRARELALNLSYGEREMGLIRQAGLGGELS